MNIRTLFCMLASGLAWLAASSQAHAQWLTQTNELKAGWNAVYLHVDASFDTLHNLVGPGASTVTPIQEVWMWTPVPATHQFIQTPQEPIEVGSQWMSWKRAGSESSPLQRLTGNVACLVYVTADYTWLVKGRPAVPNHQWTLSGMNFVGFPTVPAGPPSFEAFLSQAPTGLYQSVQSAGGGIYRYPGGELGQTSPAMVSAYRTTVVRRGEAFWVRAGDLYHRYYGPFALVSPGTRGVDFGNSLGTSGLRLRNLTAHDLTVTLELVPSEAPPDGQPTIAGTPSLLVRGTLNTTNLLYGYTNLAVGGFSSWLLTAAGLPGSEVEVVLGLNRSALVGNPGDQFAGTLRFTDSLGHSQVDAPVAATVASSAGLWVGGAAVTQVGQYLKTYETGTNGALALSTNAADFGAYITTSINTNLGTVPRFYPLRLIVHNPTNGAGARLLQRVYLGPDAFTNFVVATRESVLHSGLLSQARRVSAAHLPWSEDNDGWAFSGVLGAAATVTATVTLDYADQASNPFLHSYHPDHDNRDALFQANLPQGVESHTVVRDITLEVTPPPDDFGSLTAGGQTLSGHYAETIRLLGLARAGGTTDTREFVIAGAFTLSRIAEVPLLTTTP